MTGDQLFEEYIEKEQRGVSAFFKNPKSWILIVGIVAAVVLVLIFIKSLAEGMSSGEVKESIEIIGVDTKWVDKEVTPEEVKIVPAITFKIKNVGKRPLQFMDLEAVFHFVETGAVHSDGMARILIDTPLNPGETSDEIVIKSLYGYSGQSRGSFYKNKDEWKQMEVKLFARAKGSGLVPVGETYPVKQVIEGFNPTDEAGEQMPEDYPDDATRELAQSIRIAEQDSLWVDRVVTAEKVIIVPSITLSITNVGQKPLQDLYFKGVFKYEDTGEVLTEGIAAALDKPLAPGETSQSIGIKGEFGYTASSKEAFYQDTDQRWNRLKVHLYAKNKESQYALLAIFPIKAKIEGVQVVYQ